MAERKKNEKYKGIVLPEKTTLNERYIIDDVLGVGGFGITYSAFDIYNKSTCAVKELFINDVVKRSSDGKTVKPYEERLGLFNHGVKRFMEEAEILNSLNGTPNVVHITDYFRENNTAYFVMDYIEGPTLGQFIMVEGGSVSVQRASDIIYKVGRTLEFINTRYGIFHRDLSPENILLRRDGEPVIIDFGNAKNYVRNTGESMSVVLKPGFAPPEQYTGKNQGPWTDVYSLSGIFYYMVTGRKIPQAPDRIAGATYQPLADIVADCPYELSEAIDRGLAIDYKKRIKSTGALVQMFYAPEKSVKEVFPYLMILEGNFIKEKWRLPLEEEILVGRDDKQSKIVIRGNDRVSKQHMIIAYSPKSRNFVITDISTNGTFINGSRIEKGKQQMASSGSVVYLAGKECALKLELQ